MSLLTIRNQIITEIGGRDDLDDVIDDQVNYALQEISTMYNFEELETSSTMSCVDGEASYLMPSDLYVLWTVKDETDNNPLERKEYTTFDKMDETTTGTPKWYATFNKSLILFNKVPDDSTRTIRIRYWARHGTLADDADTITLPLEWERGVRLKSSCFVFGILDMDEKQAAKQAEFDRWLSRIQLPQAQDTKKNKTSRMNFGYGRNHYGARR
jgi:hypothetical protein